MSVNTPTINVFPALFDKMKNYVSLNADSENKKAI